MERLWAPWRFQYVKEAVKRTEEGCIFCEKPSESNDQENLILHRGKTGFIILNKYPYNNGHLMVVPYRHVAELHLLTPEEKLELMELIAMAISALKKAMSPHGFNIGMNLGRVAGAGIDEHLHFHVVPRWRGDTNFMTVTGDTKVISAGLKETWEGLKPYFADE